MTETTHIEADSFEALFNKSTGTLLLRPGMLWVLGQDTNFEVESDPMLIRRVAAGQVLLYLDCVTREAFRSKKPGPANPGGVDRLFQHTYSFLMPDGSGIIIHRAIGRTADPNKQQSYPDSILTAFDDL